MTTQRVVVAMRVSPEAKQRIADEAAKNDMKPGELGRRLLAIGFKHWTNGER